jgi:hypothetical protein
LDIIHRRKWSQNLPRFDALSYVQDDSPEARRINVGSSIFNLHVTQDCSAALQRLRYKKKATLMWIDPICIDQMNNEEKPSQVWHMGEICGLAKTVIVFLGDADNVSISIWNFIKRNEYSLLLTSSHDIPEAIEDAVGIILTRHWYSRVWVL